MSRVQRRCARPAATGFTLLEILLVLVILALTASLTLPALVRPAGTELRVATGTVVTALRRAREAAVNRQRPTVLVVDVDARSILVSGEETTPRRLPEHLELTLFTARSELEGERRGRIRFFPDGSSTGGRVTVASGERRYHVDVDWLTGQVRVRAGMPGDGAGDGADAAVELRS